MRSWTLLVVVAPTVKIPQGLGHEMVETGPSRRYVLRRARLWRSDFGDNVDMMIVHDGVYEDVNDLV